MSSPPTSLPGALGMIVPIPTIERELNAQFKAAALEQHAPVRKVRMSNLVVYCDHLDTALELAEQVPNVTAVHPARVLLLIRDDESTEKHVTAGVLVRCRTLGHGQQACSEQVALHAPAGLADRLPFLMRRLMIGDLPTNLLWASKIPPPLAGPMLYELAEYAQQIIYDSLGWTDPPQAVAATAGWLEAIDRRDGAQWRVASDLNWRRLKYWRRLAGQSLDRASAPGAAESITDLTIEHGPHAVVQGWSLAAWFAQKLSWELLSGTVRSGVEISWRFRTAKDEAVVHVKRLPEAPPKITRVRIACTQDGIPVVMNLAPDDGFRLAITLEGTDAAPRTVTVPPLTPAELIGRQLSDREPDPRFRQSMAVAQAMARSVIK